jgi:N-acetylmuramoyl-L-alanine amidase
MKSFKTWLVAVVIFALLLAAGILQAAERKRRKDREKTTTETTGAATNAPAATPSAPSGPKPVTSPDLKVVRPAPGEELTVSEGASFVMGTLPSDQFTLRCNGKLCDVFSEGAFIGFVPIKRLNNPMTINQKSMDAYFEFVAIKDSTRMTNIVYCITPNSPSARKAITEKLTPPRTVESSDDRWVGMENDVAADGKSLVNLGKVVFFPKGARIKVKEKKADLKGDFYLVEQPIEGGALWIPAADFKETQDPIPAAALSTEFASTKKSHATVYTFDTPVPVPLIVEETADRSTLKLRFLSTPPRAFVFPQPASIWGFIASYENGADGKTTVVVEFAPDINKEKPFQGLKIVVDPGHHPDAGALGPRATEERNLALLLSRQLAENLKAQGAEVTLSREEQPLELSQRPARFKALNPDLVISMHLNSVSDAEDPRLRWGTQTIYLYPHSQPLGRSIHRYLTPRIRGHDLATVQRNLVVTRFPSCPTVLVESTHIIMPEEEKKLLTPEYREEIAKAITEGISNFLLGEGQGKR